MTGTGGLSLTFTSFLVFLLPYRDLILLTVHLYLVPVTGLYMILDFKSPYPVLNYL